jgi:hypothetical protein
MYIAIRSSFALMHESRHGPMIDLPTDPLNIKLLNEVGHHAIKFGLDQVNGDQTVLGSWQDCGGVS